MDQTQQRQTTPLGSHAGSVHETADASEQIRIEDLPLDKKLEHLRKYNPYHFFDEGRYIDAQDSINQWCLGQILTADNRNVQIHFDGWSNRWDVWQKIISYKIAPFRKYSRGYTGQQKIALRQNMKFSMDDLHNQKQRVQNLIDQDLNGLGAFDTTQYLRGNLYVYVDFLLQNNNYTEEQIDAINDFLYHVLRLIIQWIKKLPKLIYLYSQIKVNPDLYLIDENIAILLSAYELMDILKKILCCCHRCARYFFLSDKNPIQLSKMVTLNINRDYERSRKRDEEDVDIDEIKEMITSRRGIIFGQLMNFVNYFNEFGGFDAILDFLKLGNEGDDKIPLDMISMMTLPFRACSQIFSEEFSKYFSEAIKDIICTRLNSMTDKDVKEIDKEIVGRVLIELKDIFTLSMNEIKAAEIIEQNLLNVSLKFLKSSYLEKRLKGISDIKLLIERVEYAQKQQEVKNSMQIDQKGQRYNMADDVNQKGLKPPKWLTAQELKDWILREKILEIVLGENTHLEIVKRSGCILKFLAKEASLPYETVDLIWKCQLGKHEEMVRVVYHMIQELVPHVDVKYIDLLHQKIQQVPAIQYDEKFIDFLKFFTMKSLENYYDFKSNEGSLSESMPQTYNDIISRREKEYIVRFVECLEAPQQNLELIDDKQFGLPIFWELIQDKAPQVSNEIMQLAITAFNEILKEIYCQPIRIIYLVRAVDNLRKGESIAQSIIVCQNIISQFREYEYGADTSVTISKLIEHLQKQVQIIDKVINNISQYHLQVKEKLTAYQQQKKQIPEDLSNFTFVGKHSHDLTLNLLLGFLEFLIEKSEHRVSLGNLNIDTLWRNFVQQPNILAEQSLFLKWINKTRESNDYDRKEIYLFTDDERKYFFTKILCNPTYVNSKVSYGQVKCFQKYFKVINEQEMNIEYQRKKMKVTAFEKILGLEALWKISIENENEKAREESMDLLVDIHLKLDIQMSVEEQQRIWTKFINDCMRLLENDNQDFMVANTIQLMSRFLDRYEGKKPIKTEVKVSQYTMQTTGIMVMNRTDQSRRQVQASYFQTIGTLRQKIADAFEMQINEFIMTIKNSYVEPDEDDDKYLKECGVINNVIIQRNPNYNPNNHPKFLISNNQANYDRLFQLLTKENPQLVEPTWELLQKLPTNSKLQQEIKDLQGLSQGSPGWEKLLDPRSTNKLYYSLDIITRLQMNKKDPKIQQWRFKFIQMGGFHHLLQTFISLEIKQIDSTLSMRCIESLIMILFEFFLNEKELLKTVLENKENVVLQGIRLMDMIADYTLRVEKRRGESYEDLNKRVIANKLKKSKYKSYMPGNKAQPEQNKKADDDEDQESQEFTQMTEMNKQFNLDNQIVSNLFKFVMHTVFSSDPGSVNLIAKYPNLEDLLFKSTIQTENWYMRVETMKRIKEIIQLKLNQELGPLQDIIKILFFSIQSKTDHFETRCNFFYDGISQILDNLAQTEVENLRPRFENLIQELAHFILNREIREKNTTEQDHLLIGRMKLLKSLLQKLPQFKDLIGAQLTDHLLHNCLFEVPQGGTTKNQNKAGPPKCKSQNSRKNASNLLAVLCRDSLNNLTKVLEYMKQFNANPSWRTNKDTDWNISLMDSEKSSTGYVGIKNLGCICYMNSLFQQLFMISSFRNDLLSVKDPSSAPAEKEENMLYQLQILFAGLLKSEKQYVSPKGFCHAFKDWEGQPTNVLEQMDVEEFFNMLMDRIETAIKGSPQQNSIQYNFGGKFASEMICKGCPHKYERSEPFLSISIPVKNKKSIIDGLTAFIQGDMLEGDNQYLCEKCDKKVDALKRTCVKKLPRHLIIALRRFEFDYDKMIRVKVNDYCEFPLDLSMEQFTQEGLAKKERQQKMKEEKGEDAENDETQTQEEPLKYPKDYYEYTLSGIVVHSGTADSGHYYSFVKDRDHPESGKWYELNDHIVRDFDPNDIPSECFGGEDTFTGYNMVQMKTMKWRNAYLLIYERKNTNDIVHSDEELDKTSSFKQEDVEMKTATQDLSILTEIEEKIAYENQKYWQNRFLFSGEYQELVHDVSLNWNTSNLLSKTTLTKNNDAHIVGFPIPDEYFTDNTVAEPLDLKLPIKDPIKILEFEERVFKFASSFYITVLQRSQNKTFVPQMLNLLKAYINKNSNCAGWLITQFSNFKILEENLLQCGQKEMRKFVTGLLYCAMLKLYPEEKHLLRNYWVNPQNTVNNQTKIGNFALILLHNIFNLKRFVANFPQYFQLIARFSSLGPEAREFLLRAKGIGRLMEFFYDEVSPHKEHFRDFSDVNPIYNERPEIGLPTEIDRKQMNQFQETLEKRRMKNLQEAPPKYKYLVEAVSLMIRAFKNIERSPFQTDEVQFEALQQQERDLFIPDSKFLKQVFDNSKKNRSLKAVALGYAHFAWVEKEAFNEIFNMIQHALNDNDHDDLRQYLYLLQVMLEKPGGDPHENRFETLMMMFLETVKQNSIYYKYMETIIEFVLKITSKLPTVKEWFRIKKPQWLWLKEWSEQSKYPTNLMDTSLRLLKRRAIQMNQQHLKQEAFRNITVRDARNKRLELLALNQQPELSQEVDMDIIDLQDYKFTRGELLEIFYRRHERIQLASVEQVLDELIHLKYLNVQTQEGYQQNQMQWMGTDTDKLYTRGTYTSLTRTKFIDYFNQQYEKLRREQQVAQSANQIRQSANPNDMEFDQDTGNYAGGSSYNNVDNSDDDDEASDNEYQPQK